MNEATCTRHPDVETALTCGRCETPICPRCMVHTPGGIRCPDCAMMRRPVMYQLEPQHYARAIAAAAVVGAVLGVAGTLVLPPSLRLGLLSLAIGLLGGIGAGAVVGEAISRATGYKRGTALQVTAAAAIVVAFGIRAVLSGLEFSDLSRDTVGAIAVIAGVVSAWGRLR